MHSFFIGSVAKYALTTDTFFMFTGIIQKIGTVKKKSEKSLMFQGFFNGLKVGSSIAVNGTCLTITKIDGDKFSSYLMQETLEVTTLGGLKEGGHVNLEPPMRADSFVEGHFVQGHVDTIGKITSIKNMVYKIEYGKKWNKFAVRKGSIAIDGVSLTVSKKGDGFICVSIIPHTFKNTIFHIYKAGANVNIEFDIIGKYILNQSNSRHCE